VTASFQDSTEQLSVLEGGLSLWRLRKLFSSTRSTDMESCARGRCCAQVQLDAHVPLARTSTIELFPPINFLRNFWIILDSFSDKVHVSRDLEVVSAHTLRDPPQRSFLFAKAMSFDFAEQFLQWWPYLVAAALLRVAYSFLKSRLTEAAELALEGKSVCVCGASQGLGRELALYYASLGAKVAVVARSKDALEQLADECGK
jgi:hypothetical protein